MKSALCFSIFSLLLLMPIESKACSCKGQNTVEQEIKASDIVFSARVISSQLILNLDSLHVNLTGTDKERWKDMKVPLKIAAFEVNNMYKGDKQDTLFILTNLNGAACGVKFIVGEKYIVYATKSNDMSFPPYQLEEKYEGQKIYWTHSCTRTDYYFNEEESDILAFISQKQNGAR